MSVLVVAATFAEVAPLAAALSLQQRSNALWQGRHRDFDVDLLITGVGMVATAVQCTRRLLTNEYGLALNLGVCGSFDPQLPPGTVVHVEHDSMPELGAEDGSTFLPLTALNLLDKDEYPYRGGQLFAEGQMDNPVVHALPRVKGITVNTVHGAEESIATVVARTSAQVESMEGAAFMYACLMVDRPGFAQIRAVSNMVERRNRGAWKMAEAVKALNDTAFSILDYRP